MPAILIVDNEEKFCKVIQASLALESLQADYCTSGEDALAYLEARPVDALVSDARAQGFRIVPQCWYVEKKFDENPDWADLRA